MGNQRLTAFCGGAVNDYVMRRYYLTANRGVTRNGNVTTNRHVVVVSLPNSCKSSVFRHLLHGHNNVGWPNLVLAIHIEKTT